MASYKELVAQAEKLMKQAEAARKAVAAKYRNPANGDTWSGRGRVPKWLLAIEAAGHKRDEFAVK